MTISIRLGLPKSQKTVKRCRSHPRQIECSMFSTPVTLLLVPRSSWITETSNNSGLILPRVPAWAVRAPMNVDIKMYDLAALSASGITASAPWGRPSLAAVPDRFYMPLHSSVGSRLADWQAVRFIYSQWVSESPCHVRPWNTQNRKHFLANIHQLTMVGLKCWMVNIRHCQSTVNLPLCIPLKMYLTGVGSYLNIFSWPDLGFLVFLPSILSRFPFSV